MGLDMYLEGRTFNWTDWENPDNNPTRDGFKIKGITLELGYWRKHPDLHGYIVQTFAGGEDNCQDIYLTVENMRQIIQAIKDRKLPHTEGFFFGQSQRDDDAPSIEIFEKAIAWVEGADNAKLRNIPAPEPIGAGLAAIKIETEVVKEIKETRDVVYRASW